MKLYRLIENVSGNGTVQPASQLVAELDVFSYLADDRLVLLPQFALTVEGAPHQHCDDDNEQCDDTDEDVSCCAMHTFLCVDFDAANIASLSRLRKRLDEFTYAFRRIRG